MIFVCALVILVLTLAIAGYRAERRRREALFALAVRLGLRFDAPRNHDLAARYGFLNRLARGDNRYLFNILSGVLEGHEVLAADYHYETHSSSSKGGRQTHHHYLSLYALRLPRSVPELTVVPEGVFSKVAQALGYDDIDFESHEFSRTFCVRSRDKKFAYDVCNARLMEYLLGHKDVALELESDTLALVLPGKLTDGGAAFNLRRVLEIRARLPGYLFEDTQP